MRRHEGADDPHARQVEKREVSPCSGCTSASATTSEDRAITLLRSMPAKAASGAAAALNARRQFQIRAALASIRQSISRMSNRSVSSAAVSVFGVVVLLEAFSITYA
jgi:hypothetical protein